MPPKKSDTAAELNLASVLFAWVGVGYLFPFSALTQPVDYWHLMFPQFNIEFPLTTLYLWTNLLFLALLVFLGGEPSYTTRIIGGFCGQFLVLAAVPTYYFFHFDEATHYFLVMCAVGLAAIATAFVDSVAISFSSQYPVQVQEALQFGIGLSTLIGSVYRLVTKAVFPPDQIVASSLLYFYCGALTILLCIGAYYWLLSLPISKRYVHFGLSESSVVSTGGSSIEITPWQDETSETDNLRQCFDASKISSSPLTRYSPDLNKSPARGCQQMSSGSSSYGNGRDTNGAESAADIEKARARQSAIETHSSEHRCLLEGQGQGQGQGQHGTGKRYGGVEEGESATQQQAQIQIAEEPNKWVLLRRVAFREFIVFALFFSTLLLWPPLVTEMKSFNFPLLQATGWWPLLLLTLFSFADCTGRLSTPYRGCLTADNLWVAVVARFSLFPLIICSVRGVLFTHDAFSVLFVFLLGFTNGYLGTLSIVMVNEGLQDHERGVVGTFTGFFLNLGLVGGATAALAFEKLVLSIGS